MQVMPLYHNHYSPLIIHALSFDRSSFMLSRPAVSAKSRVHEGITCHLVARQGMRGIRNRKVLALKSNLASFIVQIFNKNVLPVFGDELPELPVHQRNWFQMPQMVTGLIEDRMPQLVTGLLVSWILFATAFYHLYSDLPGPTALFYAVDTVLGEGFGVYSPKDDIEKFFVIANVLVGATLVSGALAYFADRLLTKRSSIALEEMERGNFEKTLLATRDKSGVQSLEFDLDTISISTAELREVVGKLGENVSEEEIDAIVLQTDINGDGRITYDEFVKSRSKMGGQKFSISQVYLGTCIL